jgi:hypothetical protein
MDLGELIIRVFHFGFGIYETERDRKRAKQRGSELRELSGKMTSVDTSRTPVSLLEGAPTQDTQNVVSAPKNASQSVAVGTACIPCCVHHFSTCAGLISDEAIRMARRHGIDYQEVINRILKCFAQLNAMEREDLAVEKVQNLSGWEKDLAIYAQNKGAEIRHILDNISSIDDLERAAVEISQAQDYVGGEWLKHRLAKQAVANPVKVVEEELGLTLEEAKELAAAAAVKEVERQWHSQEKK